MKFWQMLIVFVLSGICLLYSLHIDFVSDGKFDQPTPIALIVLMILMGLGMFIAANKPALINRGVIKHRG